LKALRIDTDYLLDILLKLLFTPSPSGYTDRVVHLVCEELERFGVPFELTRRGAIRATLKGEARGPTRPSSRTSTPSGAMVKALKPNGRLQLVPVGHWNARFAEGARCTLFTDITQHRGTILPMKASGHTFGPEIDSQPGGWDHVELRIDERVTDLHDLLKLGVHVGDFVAIDTNPEVTATGFINSRHLDDKAGAALLLAATKAVKEHDVKLPVDCHPLFTISEEIGSGASAALHQDVAEMLTIDNGTTAPGRTPASSAPPSAWPTWAAPSTTT
jgi:putative aminopeptidase FrvX